jgi:hypothetical protein
VHITFKTFIRFVILSLISISAWFLFTYPQLAFVNLKTNRAQALQIAKDYLQNRGVDHASYTTSIVFKIDTSTSRYLQKTIGFDNLIQFIRDYDVDLFYWVIRFFKEKTKEEYSVIVSSSKGEIISFAHTIDENEARKILPREEAKLRGIDFLKKQYGFVLEEYSLKGDLLNVYDRRSDLALTWQKNDVQIPWSPKENSGTGKLLMAVKVSGEEILSFSKNVFSIPDQFNRDLETKGVLNNIISMFTRPLSMLLLAGAIYYLVARRNHLAMHLTKKLYIGVFCVFVLLSVLSYFNLYQSMLSGYKTTTLLSAYLSSSLMNTLMSVVFLGAAIIPVGLSGELLRHEVASFRKRGSFLHYTLSNFLTRDVAKSLGLGYFVCILMLGLQSLIFEIGQRYWGVWVEYSLLTQLTTAYFPILAAFTIGFKAAFSEEIMFRLFAINWGQKIFKSLPLAVLFSSLIWGFSHSGYPVFPMWFRGIEVTLLGFFLSFIYLNFGLIPVITAHYLFDVFWHTSEHIFGHSTPYYTVSSLFVLGLPLLLGVVAWIVNKSTTERPMRWQLNQHQEFNLNLLKDYLRHHPEILAKRSYEEVKKEIINHGWDVAVVDIALEELKSAGSTG